MLSPEEFRSAWQVDDDELQRFTPESLAGLPIPEDARRFLLEGGLPEDAAPFLSFTLPETGRLPDLASSYGRALVEPPWWIIGSDGSGSPIVIADDGRILLLDHDHGFSPQFINGSVAQLAASLLAFRQAMSQALAEGGEDAVLDNRIPELVQQRLRDELGRIDPAALAEDAFWAHELTDLSEEAWNAVPNRIGTNIGLALLVVITIVLGLWLLVREVSGFSLAGDCENRTLTRTPSPDGRNAAIVFSRSSGATTDPSTQVSLIAAATALENDGGNVFVADGGPAAGAPLVEIRWTDSQHLIIRHAPGIQIFRAEPAVGPVLISYETFDQ